MHSYYIIGTSNLIELCRSDTLSNSNELDSILHKRQTVQIRQKDLNRIHTWLNKFYIPFLQIPLLYFGIMPRCFRDIENLSGQVLDWSTLKPGLYPKSLAVPRQLHLGFIFVKCL